MKKHWKNIRCSFDRHIGAKIRKISIPLLRISLGIVFLWFGLLKIFGVSPVRFIIENTYYFLPFPATIIFLGILESLIGLGLILKKFIRVTIILLWLQMLGIFGSLFFNFHLFCDSNPLILTLEGEFVLKNLVLIAGSLVIIGYKAPVDKT